MYCTLRWNWSDFCLGAGSWPCRESFGAYWLRQFWSRNIDMPLAFVAVEKIWKQIPCYEFFWWVLNNNFCKFQAQNAVVIPKKLERLHSFFTFCEFWWDLRLDGRIHPFSHYVRLIISMSLKSCDASCPLFLLFYTTTQSKKLMGLFFQEMMQHIHVAT